jgi:hypothetical protein
MGLGSGCAVEAHIHRSTQLLEAVELTVATARMARGISQSVPEAFQPYAQRPASATHLVAMALQALERVGCYESPDGWLWLLTGDLSYGEPGSPEECAEVLKELAHGVTLGTETSDLYEVGTSEMPAAYQMAFSLMGSADDPGEPAPFASSEEDARLPLALATGLSLAGLIFADGGEDAWPESSPYWQALVFFDGSSGNELVDLRTGTADVGWDGLHILRDMVADAKRYLHAAFAFMDAVDKGDPIVALIAWAGHLRRDLRRATGRANRRTRKDTPARSDGA